MTEPSTRGDAAGSDTPGSAIPESDAPESDAPVKGVAALRTRVQAAAGRGVEWLEGRRAERVPWDLAATFYERDREAFASVLGAAIALRLFLFIVPVMVAVVGLVVALLGSDAFSGLLSEANVTGSLASQVSSAATRSKSTGLVLLGTGAFLALLAGRSLTSVLAACSASAWRIGARDAKSTLRMSGTVSVLVFLLVAVSGIINRVREAFGLGVIALSFFAAAALYAAGWFAVSMSLPKGTRDPGAVLPGAALVGVAMASLQWFMQFYLPAKIARSSEVMGSLGFTVATLGYMFLVGRLMASSLILNAVVWDRLGSISGVVFSLPYLRRLPERSERLRRFFDLDRQEAE